MISAATVALALSAGVAQAQDAEFNIQPQSLTSALYEFGSKSSRQVMFTPDVTASKTTRGVSGVSDEMAALDQLLKGTGLTYRANGNTLIVMQQEGGGSPQDQSAAGGGAEVEELIVTAQKKEEAIQDVPIAISAFTQKSLDAQKIEGGYDLLKAIPNVTFSKSNFSGYNFSIRGIGTKAISATTDPGVAVAFNNSTLIVNRLFEQEYFDVERVEVLRGPQGTLYGRNATSGVINVISSKPRLGEFEGDMKLELGNYNAQRVRGMVNLPIGDTLALRVAGAMTKRDGYGTNLAATDPNVVNDVREDVDDRDLWSVRTTLGWEPIEQIRVNLMWERFEEDDQRVRTSKQLCHHDEGIGVVGGTDYGPIFGSGGLGAAYKALGSQGCKAGSLYDEAAFGTPNGTSLPYISASYLVSVLSQIPFTGPPGAELGLGYNPYNPTLGAAALTPPCPAEAQAGAFFYPLSACSPDPYGGQMQSTDLRTIHSQIEPIYRAKADVFDLSIDLDLTDSLTFTSQTVYAKDSYYASQDYNRFATFPVFNDSSLACGATLISLFGVQFWQPDCSDNPTTGKGTYQGGRFNVTPGGVFTDPQLGPARTLVAQDLSQVEAEQFNQEFRLASNFDADLNFSLGANFTRFETWNDYYVFLNAATLLTHFWPFNNAPNRNFAPRPDTLAPDQDPIYVDPNPLESIDGEGHNYFRSANPYELTSSALFGELYWQATETLKVTLGARMTWDRKVFTPIPSQLLLWDFRGLVPEGAGPEDCATLAAAAYYCQSAGTGVNGRGSPPLPDIVQEWREPTGRLIVDWKPDLGFTDETMVYGSIAHGYKGGGANPPTIAPPAGLLVEVSSGGRAAPRLFEPEYIDAFEVGTKNTLLDGALVLNGSAFYYDYEGYQVSKIIDRSAANENFDAKIWGVEFEWIYSPTRNLRFNGTVGHLRSEIAEGETSIDLMDRTDGGHRTHILPDGTEGYSEWMVMKPWISSSSNCVVPTEVVKLLLDNPDLSSGLVVGGTAGLLFLCPGGQIAGHTFAGYNAQAGFNPDGTPRAPTPFRLPGGVIYDPRVEAPNGGAGFAKELGGNDLPNAPHWTVSFGAQYRFALPGGWDGTLRGDFYWQDESFARVYNSEYDELRAWTNTNISLWFEQPDWGVTAEVYVKNAFDETPITDAFLNSDDSGLTTNVFTLDPRLVGVSVRKTF